VRGTGADGAENDTLIAAKQGISATVADGGISTVQLEALDADMAGNGVPTAAQLEALGADMARVGARLKAKLAGLGAEVAWSGARAPAKLARTPELWDAPKVDTQLLEQEMGASSGHSDLHVPKSEEWLSRELDRILGPLVA
jgi:hypothetical protein